MSTEKDPFYTDPSFLRGLTQRRISRRSALQGAGALSFAAFLAACGIGSKPAVAAHQNWVWDKATKQGTLDFANWPLYIDVGADAKGKTTYPSLIQFTKETGIKVKYNETAYDAWYQNSKNDGLNKTGAYDIYVMDDNWVAEFAAGKIIQNLDQIGFKANPDILQKGLEQGYWPPKSGARLKDFANDTPALYAVVIIDDVEILYYRKDFFSGPPKTWDDIAKVAAAKAKPPNMYGLSLIHI